MTTQRTIRVADPVWPNAGIEAWYRAQLQRLLRQMHDELDQVMRAAWREAEPDVGYATDAANPSIVLRRALAGWGSSWASRLNKMSDDLAKRFAGKNYSYVDRAMRAAFAKAGWTVKFRPTVQMVTAYKAVVAEQVNLIKSIPSQYLKDVQTSVWAAVMKGGDLHTLSADLQENYGVSFRRAALIARDQNAKAKVVMESVRRLEVGIDDAVWLHSHAGKEPRPTHVAMNGKRYKIREGMYDDDPRVMAFVHPGELINCRCVSKPVVPEFDY